MTEISIAGEIFNVLIEGDENKAVLMLSNPLGTNLHLWDPQLPVLPSISGSCAMICADMAQAWPIRDLIPSKASAATRSRSWMCSSIEKVHWLGLSMGSIVGLWLLIHARERIGRAVLANTAAQIPGPDLWNSRIQSARRNRHGWRRCGSRRALVHKGFPRHQSGKSGARLGDGPDHAAKRLFGRLRGGARHGSARSHSKHRKQGPGYRRAARSVDTARYGRLGCEFHRRRQIHHAGSIAYFEYRG